MSTIILTIINIVILLLIFVGLIWYMPKYKKIMMQRYKRKLEEENNKNS